MIHSMLIYLPGLTDHCRRFLQAVGKFPAICGDYADGRDADTICKRTLATMFAHFTQASAVQYYSIYSIRVGRCSAYKYVQ